MRISDDIKIIRELLNISQEDFAKEIGVPFESINRWETGALTPTEKNVNMIYSYAFDNKIYLNIIHEQMLKDEFKKENDIVLFHGSKNQIIGDIDLVHSRGTNDFGSGFYLGESFDQAALYISFLNSSHIYAYLLNKKDLKVVSFDVSQDWMFAIAYYRGWLDKYKNHEKIKDLVAKIEETDIIIAPIADNKMFDLIEEFVSGMTTDVQCEHALSATNLGYQYVIKSNKALSRLSLLNEMFLSDSERKHYLTKRVELSKVSQDKVKVSRIEYRNKGNYIEEILKWRD